MYNFSVQCKEKNPRCSLDCNLPIYLYIPFTFFKNVNNTTSQ